MSARGIDELLEELRASFDGAFARPAEDARAGRGLLVAVRVSGEPFALRPHELTSLVRAPSIVPLPGTARGRVGLASVRGALVPVYALAPFLGLPPEPVRWLAVCAASASGSGVAASSVALGFAELEGSLEAGPSSMASAVGRRRVIELGDVVSAIRRAVEPAREE